LQLLIAAGVAVCAQPLETVTDPRIGSIRHNKKDVVECARPVFPFEMGTRCPFCPDMYVGDARVFDQHRRDQFERHAQLFDRNSRDVQCQHSSEDARKDRNRNVTLRHLPPNHLLADFIGNLEDGARADRQEQYR
jgi:hypothetical protein